MSLHHLDPRKAGTDAAPDVRTEKLNGTWYVFRHSDQCGIAWEATEADALRAARQAAGFGDVAEQPCDAFAKQIVATADGFLDVRCAGCHWSRDAHGVRS